MRFTSIINHTTDTFTRPITTEIAQRVALELGIDDSIKVKNVSRNAKRGTKGGRMGQSNLFTFDSEYCRIIVDVDETVPDSAYLGKNTQKPNTYALFMDKERGIMVWPQYINVNLKFSFTVRLHSRTEADFLSATLQKKRIDGRQIELQEVTYSYGLPVDIMVTLEKLYNHMVTNGSTESIHDWIGRCRSKKITGVRDPSGKHTRPVVSETQERIIARGNYLDGNTIGDAEDTGITTLNFTYEAWVDKPLSMLIEYPTVVQGVPIPKELRPLKKYINSDVSDYATASTLNGRALANKNITDRDMINIPSYDEWTPKPFMIYHTPVLSLLFTLDEPKTNVLFNINDIIEIEESVRDYILKYHDRVGELYRSWLYLTVFKDDSSISHEITMDAEGNMKTKVPLKNDGTYHFVVMVMDTPMRLIEKDRYTPIGNDDFLNRYFLGFGWDPARLPESYTRDNLLPLMKRQSLLASSYQTDKFNILTANTFAISAGE